MSSGGRSVAIMAAGACVAMLSACGASSGETGGDEDFTTSLQFGTANPGGVYYPLGAEYSTIFEDTIEVDGLGVTAIETGASVENLAKIGRGEIQLGLAQNNTAMDAVEGAGEFDGAQIENAGFMGKLYPEALHIVTRESTGIESLAEAEGKRIAIGPPGSASQQAAKDVLGAYGLDDGDYTALEEGFDDAKTKLQDGNADIVMEIMGVPYAGLQELEATTGDVTFLPVGDAELQTMLDETSYEEYEIPAETYEFLDEPVATPSAFSCLFGSTTQVSEDLGYEITKSLYENADQLTLPQKEDITTETALDGRGELPLHPGAERYFEEAGILG
ncbi:MAG TPA: TAXI family TRAP transporter solute-binding subunit [Jiangellaceae bacterium]|nr:TAXI family TRAP transporter solute-binding subunit [Jiangellaceae bacterium]